MSEINQLVAEQTPDSFVENRDYLEPNTYERTFEGYLELLLEAQATERALDSDYKASIRGDRAKIEAAAADAFGRMNAQREQPVDIKTVDDDFLIGIAQPQWRDYFPKDGSLEEQEAWDQFQEGFSISMQANLAELYVVDSKLGALHSDETLQDKFAEYGERQAEVARVVMMRRVATKQAEKIQKEIVTLRAAGRPLTTAEKRLIDRKTLQLGELDKSWQALVDTKEKADEAIKMYTRSEALDDKRQMEKGLLLTDQMQEIVNEVLPSLVAGKPALFVGETGGAKTALSEFISHEYFGAEPEFISGYGDVNSYQLLGKQELHSVEGASESEFVNGPIVRAMENGVPLILDEINAMPPELLKRLNKIMQLRPGDTFTIQEDSGREVTIKPGFCIIATANEKSARYKGVEDLSVEFQNRFGANIYRIRYPDANAAYADAPIENMRLAKAAVVDANGEFPDYIDADEMYRFVKAARITQQIYSGTNGEGFNDLLDADSIARNKPGLEVTVIAPRTMLGIINDVREANGSLSFEQRVRRLYDSVKNDADKKVMSTILRNHGFLK
ncbi:MAG: AAA family ATPase [Candidatus Microsaccharimonas sp.]